MKSSLRPNKKKTFQVSSGATLVAPEEMIERASEVHVSSGGFLVLLKPDQTPDDVVKIMAEHHRHREETDRIREEARRAPRVSA